MKGRGVGGGRYGTGGFGNRSQSLCSVNSCSSHCRFVATSVSDAVSNSYVMRNLGEACMKGVGGIVHEALQGSRQCC